ncbi:MAG: glycosyltransferase family 39 protein [Candidatus Moranbacteria bacterium]|nr:glycosyltransferase family 39 protein [Candidatus Moranbacteria bacterium]
MRQKYFFILLTIFAALGGLLFYWNTLNAPFERDEGEYAYSARLLLDGEMPYENSFLQKPPMIVYTYALALLISPTALWPPRLIALVFTVLSAVLIGAIAKKEYGSDAGIIAALVFVPMNAFPFLSPFAANTERFMQLPLLGLLALYVYRRENAGWRTFFLAGLFASLAFFYKQICALPAAFIFLFWILEKAKIWPFLKEKILSGIQKASGLFAKAPPPFQKFDFGKLVSSAKYILPAFFGFLAGTFLIFGYFILKGKLLFVWESAFDFNRYYVAQNDFFSSASYFSLFWKHWPILCLILIWFLARKLPRAGFYLALFFLSLISVTTSPIRHYFLLVIPFWAIIIGASLGELVLVLENRLRTKNHLRKNVPLFAVSTAILIVAALPAAGQFEKSPDEMNLWVYGVENPFDEARVAGQKLKEATRTNDRVFIAGSEPEILFYSQRKNVSRFDITYPFIINTPFREKYQKEAVAELEKNPPAAIIFSNLETSGFRQDDAPQIMSDYIDNLTQDDYVLEGAFIRRPDLSGYWKDSPLDTKEAMQATLLLYLKKSSQ